MILPGLSARLMAARPLRSRLPKDRVRYPAGRVCTEARLPLGAANSWAAASAAAARLTADNDQERRENEPILRVMSEPPLAAIMSADIRMARPPPSAAHRSS